MTRILVTGGRGFIGRATVTHLEQLGHEVTVFDAVLGQDVREYSDVYRAVEGHDQVVHLAGLLGTDRLYACPHDAVDVNVHGTLNVLEACRVHGAGYTGITMPAVWHNPYQATRQCAHNLALSYLDLGVEVRHVRAFNGFGPGQSLRQGKFIPTWSLAAWRGEPLPVYGDGSHTIDCVPVTWIADRLARAMDTPWMGTLDAGSGVASKVLDVARYVCDYVRSHGGPQRQSIEFLPMRWGEQRDPGADNVARDGCGFELSDLDEAIESYRPC